MERHTRHLRLPLVVVIFAMIGSLPAAAQEAPNARSQDACTAAFAGAYTVHHMEMGGGILLRREGSFLYQLSYGALDEEAQGHWTCDAGTVFLTSDPVEQPRFVTLAVQSAPHGQLRVTLDLPNGMSRQYFSALIRKSDGSAEQLDFREDGLTADFTDQARPVSIQPLLPIYDIVGNPVPLHDGDGFDVSLRFLPNDLGKVAFTRTALNADGRLLTLLRFGEAIQFQLAGTTP